MAALRLANLIAPLIRSSSAPRAASALMMRDVSTFCTRSIQSSHSAKLRFKCIRAIQDLKSEDGAAEWTIWHDCTPRFAYDGGTKQIVSNNLRDIQFLMNGRQTIECQSKDSQHTF
eukprot:scaffold27962_cov52-Attheya_sp.AAC.5